MAVDNATSASSARFNAAMRVNHSLTASAEKQILLWTARRMPQWMNSDHLTTIGFTAQIGAGICYALARWDRRMMLFAIAFLVLNWFGDSLDGTLARVRSQERPRYGFYVDHMVDILGSAALMCGLGYSELLHWPVAMAMLIAFLILSAESYLATYAIGRFELSQGIFGPTEIRILLVLANLAALRNPFATLFGHRFLLFDLGGSIAAAAMAVLALAVALRHTLQLYREETLR